TVIAEDLKIGICNAMSLKAGSGNVNGLNLSEIKTTRNNNIVTLTNQEYNLGDIKLTAEKFQELFVKFFRGKNYTFKYFDKTITTISSSISEIIEKAEETLDAVDFALLVGG